MCFRIDKDFPKPKVAEEDIHVLKLYFKDSFDEIRSIVMNHQIEKGKLYTEERFPGVDPQPWDDVPENERVDYGFHSYNVDVKKDDIEFGYSVVMDCIIPKDTPYMYNKESHQYVSKQILILDVADPSKIKIKPTTR